LPAEAHRRNPAAGLFFPQCTSRAFTMHDIPFARIYGNKNTSCALMISYAKKPIFARLEILLYYQIKQAP
jgi:hypothetical protein